ncbi:MAG: thioredoxin domain-containing protein [Bacteroidota bacterium]
MNDREKYYTTLRQSDFEKRILTEKDCLNAIIFINDLFASYVIYDSIIEEVAEELDEFCTFYRINTEVSTDLTKRYGIGNIPTLLLFNQGQIVDHLYGIHPKSYLRNYIREHL